MAQQPLNAEVRTVLVEMNPVVRTGIQAALHGAGIRHVDMCKDVEGLSAALAEDIVDLVVCDAELPGADICRIVQQIRQYTLGRNPFVLIIATVGECSAEALRRLVNAGVDGILQKPMPMNRVTDQLAQLVAERRPFVATDSYVGPNRRTNPRPDDSGDTLIKVPNTLRSKLVDKATRHQLQEQISHGLGRVNEMKAQSTALTITRAVARVLAFYEGRGTLDGVRCDLDRMVGLSQDLVRQHRGTASDHLAELATSLVSLVMRISQDLEAPSKVHLQLLAKLGDVLRQVARIEDESGQVVHAIAETVGSYTGRSRLS